MPDRTCAADGCDQPHVARGLCGHHYRVARYHGTLPPRLGPTTPHAAVTKVAGAYGVTVTDIIGPSRHADIVEARRAAVHALRGLGLSWPQAGRILGGRDHTTAMNLARRQPAPAPSDPAPLPVGCHVPGCDRDPKHSTMAFCGGHDRRWRRAGTVDPDRPLRPVLADDAPVLDLEVHDRTGYRNGCRCDDCRTDAVRAVKRHRHRPGSTDTAPAIAHIGRLVARGSNPCRIARQAGLNPAVVYGWLNGRTRALRSNVDAVLALPLPCEVCRDPSLGGGRWCRPCMAVEAPRAVAS